VNSSNVHGRGGVSRLREAAAAAHRILFRAVDWMRADYPDAAPRTGHCALLALHGPPPLTRHQVSQVIDALEAPTGALTDTDIQTTIIRVTDRLPNPSQVAQVRRTQTP
jgi:Protein of unknown function (DUF3349)